MKEKAVNPFTASLSVKVFRLHSERDYIDKKGLLDGKNIIPAIGISLPSHKHSYSYYVELDTSTRLFRTDATDKIVNSLTDRASRLLIYVMRKLSKGSELVEIDIEEYQANYKIDSRQTVYNAITDLSNAGVISRHKPNKYWINPAIIFNGNRIDKYKDKVICEYEKNDE